MYNNDDVRLFHPIDHNNNMGAVRYLLSFCVLIAHTAILADIDLPLKNFSFVAVGGFFTLSGFLLFASFQKRPSLRHYLSRRARRILPPYFLIVILCAVLLVFVSRLDVISYYTSSGFAEYLAANLSFMNFLQPSLPGVFDGPQFYESAVNGSLWTMKGEWICYLSIPVLYFLLKRQRQRRGAMLWIVGIILLCLVMRYLLHYLEQVSGREIYGTLGKQFSAVFVFFYIGALINMLYPYFLRYKWYILAADVLIFAFSGFYTDIYHLFLRPFVVGTLVLLLSQVGRWGYFLRSHDDLSYDIYLFHFPIIQLVVLWGLPQLVPPLVVLLVVSVATIMLAYVSWHCVGSRFMRHRSTRK